VNDVSEDVDVTAVGRCFEEASTGELAAVDHTCVVDELPSVLDDLRSSSPLRDRSVMLALRGYRLMVRNAMPSGTLVIAANVRA
jgi:hypothetical protein